MRVCTRPSIVELDRRQNRFARRGLATPEVNAFLPLGHAGNLSVDRASRERYQQKVEKGVRSMNWKAASTWRSLAVPFLCGALLLGCADAKVEGEYPTRQKDQAGNPYAKRDSIFGKDTLSFGVGSDSKKGEGAAGEGGGGIGVNSFLWRASLDTVSFMPVTSADPFGGVIITDWYTPPETPSERFKFNVYILGRSLRADGIRVAVFRQVDGGTGGWRDAPLPEETGSRIEDAILTKARQLRFEVLQE
jgi:hypothetical protein